MGDLIWRFVKWFLVKEPVGGDDHDSVSDGPVTSFRGWPL